MARRPRINHAQLALHAEIEATKAFKWAVETQARIDAGTFPMKEAKHASRPDDSPEKLEGWVRDVFADVADRACPGWWDQENYVSRLSISQTETIQKALRRAAREAARLYPRG